MLSNYILSCVNTPSIIPASRDMYVKNAPELKDVKLCDFLQEMDDEERRIGTLSEEDIVTREERDEWRTRLQLGERLMHQIGSNILGGSICAFAAGGFGPMGVIIAGGCGAALSNKAVTNYMTAKEKAMRLHEPRLNRITDKIKAIKNKMLNLDESADLNQLNIAKNYLKGKFKYYSEAARKAPSDVYYGDTYGNAVHVSFDKYGRTYHNGKFESRTEQVIGDTVFVARRTTHYNDGHPK